MATSGLAVALDKTRTWHLRAVIEGTATTPLATIPVSGHYLLTPVPRVDAAGIAGSRTADEGGSRAVLDPEATGTPDAEGAAEGAAVSEAAAVAAAMPIARSRVQPRRHGTSTDCDGWV